MLPLQRRQVLIEYLSKHQAETIAKLSDMTNVSEMTIRRDVVDLEKMGIVRRTHGGVVFVQSSNFEEAFDDKKSFQQDLKERIAEYAIRHFVKDGHVIFLEGGTTVASMAGHLGMHRDLTIATNGLNTAQALKSVVNKNTVLCSGGILRDVSSTFVGPLSEQFFHQFHAQTVFLSATGFSVESGFTDPNLLESQVKRSMKSSARRAVMLLDSTKWGHCSTLTSFTLQEIDAVITDDGTPEHYIETIRKAGVEVHVAARS